MAGAALLDHFSALDDPRQRGKVVYPLPEIMLVVLCATLAGADDLREDAPDIVALDGKTSRRARRGDEHPLHVVSAWASRQRLVLGQQAVGAKSNELVAISLSLQCLQLTGALVTIDAMGCQTGIARTIIDRSADYLLALKDNQRSLADEAEMFFAAPAERCGEPFETIDAGHGRLETRRHWVSHDVDWLTTERRFPGEPRFPGLKASPLERLRRSLCGRPGSARPLFERWHGSSFVA